MARQKQPDRVICIEDRGKGELRWRLHYVERGRRVARGYATEEEAKSAGDRFKRLTAPLHSEPVSTAIERYIEDQVARGLWRKQAAAFKSKTATLRRFLSPIEEQPIGAVAPAMLTRCCKAWDTAERPAYVTRSLARMRARAFFEWCLRSRLVRAVPMNEEHQLQKVRSPVRRLRIDEARRLRAVVDPAAAVGDPTAIFVLAALFLGARTSELLGLTARSFDDGGRIVMYNDAKEPEQLHEVRLPEELVEPMRLLAEQAGEGPLFPAGGRHRHTWGAEAVRRWAQAAELARWDEMDARWMRRTKDTLAVEAGLSPALVARETGHTLHVARKHYIAGGAETTGRAASMARLTNAVPEAVPFSTAGVKVAK